MKGPVEACSGAHHLVLALPCQGGFLKLETTMATFKSILFDLDGTLIDSLKDIALSANQVLTELGFPEHPIEAYKKFVGDGAGTLMLRILPEAVENPSLQATFLQKWKQTYGEQWQKHTCPYDGVRDLLGKLKGDGYWLGVLSNKPHEFTTACVRVLFPGFTFDTVWGLTEGRAKKPDPSAALEMVAAWGCSPKEVLYVGDTDTDMLTAVKAGFYGLGVTWGFRSAEELMQHGARETIDRPEQVYWLLDERSKEGD